jgi:integrase
MNISPPRLARNTYGVWCVKYHDGRRSREVSTKTLNEKEAQRFFSDWLAGAGKAPDESYTFGQAWKLQAEEHDTASDRKVYSWKALTPWFGTLKIDRLTQRHVDKYVAARTADGVTSGTIRRELSDLISAANWLRKTNRVRALVLPSLRLPADSEPRTRYLSRGEMDRLLKHMGEQEYLLPVHLLVYVGLFTGARKQAIHDLTWDRVDFQCGMIDFGVPGRRATKKRRAIVPLHSYLRAVLEQVPEQYRTGNVVKSASCRRSLDTLMKEAGLVGVTMHTLRHTFASHLASAGTPLAHVAAMLGNTVSVTERTYAKFAPSALQASIEVL